MVGISSTVHRYVVYDECWDLMIGEAVGHLLGPPLLYWLLDSPRSIYERNCKHQKIIPAVSATLQLLLWGAG